MEDCFMVNRIMDSTSFVPLNSVQFSKVEEATVIQDQKANLNNFQPTSSLNQEEQTPLPADKAKKMTESINRFMETTNTNLRFQFHEDLKEYYVTIVDSKTNELVKEIPSKKLMDIYAAMRDFLGLMVDHKI